MKRIREYHIESYWAAEADKRQRLLEIKTKIADILIVGTLIVIEAALTWEFLTQIFEII